MWKHMQESTQWVDMLTKFIQLSIYIDKGNKVEVDFVGFRLWKLRYEELVFRVNIVIQQGFRKEKN